MCISDLAIYFFNGLDFDINTNNYSQGIWMGIPGQFYSYRFKTFNVRYTVYLRVPFSLSHGLVYGLRFQHSFHGHAYLFCFFCLFVLFRFFYFI